MNDQPFKQMYGTLLRLRVENHHRVKMVTWIRATGFVEGVRSIKKGEGSHADDQGYFDELTGTCCRAGRGWQPCRERNMAWNWA